jgi:hypothetical protein
VPTALISGINANQRRRQREGKPGAIDERLAAIAQVLGPEGLRYQSVHAEQHAGATHGDGIKKHVA